MRLFVVVATLLAITTATFCGLGVTLGASQPRGPAVDWSLQAQRAIVPPPAGSGAKFPGEAAVYMAIVQVAMYDRRRRDRGRLPPLRALTHSAARHGG